MADHSRIHTYRPTDMQSDSGSFRDLQLPEPLIAALESACFTRPSPLQKAAIPVLREGTDVMVQAQSGTGKTAVFAAVLLERVSLASGMPQALVLAPTRESAIQSHQVIAGLSAGLPASHQPADAVFVGGLPTADDEKKLRRTCHIIVGTPGRVCALVESGALVLNKVTSVVLDEADQLMGGNLSADVKWLVKQLPSRKQVVAFSATYTAQLTRTLEALMTRPQKVLICEETVSLLGVKQYYKLINPSNSSSSGGGSSSRDILQGAVSGKEDTNLSPQETRNGVQEKAEAAAESPDTSQHHHHHQQQQQQGREAGQQQQQQQQPGSEAQQQQGREAGQPQQQEVHEATLQQQQQEQQQQGKEAEQQEQQQQQPGSEVQQQQGPEAGQQHQQEGHEATQQQQREQQQQGKEAEQHEQQQPGSEVQQQQGQEAGQQQQQQEGHEATQQQQREQQQQGKEVEQQQQQQQPGSEAQQQQQQQYTGQELLSMKVGSLLQLLSAASFHQAVVFCNTKSIGEWLSRRMTAGGYPAAYISADLPQTQRMSTTEAINGFKVRVIVSTDVMSCGLKLDRVNLFVNLDLPANAAAYVHRVARTGSRGIAVTFVTQSELTRLQQYLQNVPAGELSPLPDVIPDDFHPEACKLESEWEQQALQQLLTAPTTTPPNSPPPIHKQPQRQQQQQQRPHQQLRQRNDPKPPSPNEATPEPFWGTNTNSIAFWRQQQQRQQQHMNPDSSSMPIRAASDASITSWQHKEQQQQQNDPSSWNCPVSTTPEPFWANNTASITFWQQQQQGQKLIAAESALPGSSDPCITAAAAADPDLAASWDAWAQYYISCGYSYPYENPYRQQAAVDGGHLLPQQQQQQQQQQQCEQPGWSQLPWTCSQPAQHQMQQQPPEPDLQAGTNAPTTISNGALTHGLLDNSVTSNGNGNSGLHLHGDTNAYCHDEGVSSEECEECELPTDDDELDPGAALLLSGLSVVTSDADPATGNHAQVEQTHTHIQNGGMTDALLEDEAVSGQVAGVGSAVEDSQPAQQYMLQGSCGYVPAGDAEANAMSAAVDAGLKVASRGEDVGAVCLDCWVASYAAWRREFEAWRQQCDTRAMNGGAGV